MSADLDAVWPALPGAEPAPAPPAQLDDSDEPFPAWWADRAASPPPEPRLTSPVYVAEAAWAAALAWAAGRAEAVGCFCGEPGEAIGNHDPRCPIALAAAIRAGRP